jgi:putative SOS response-associated peptidase YedK
MCGRFTLNATPEMVQEAFSLTSVPAFVPRFNIAPTQPVGIISNQAPQVLDFVRWGLIPPWAKDPSIGSQMINARAETAAEKPSFKHALRRRRCLIPATGFYEWPKKGEPPMYVHLTDHRLFAFAGLWETWNSPDGSSIQSCTILTTEPNDFVKQFHTRMAVILAPANYADWLTPDELDPAEALHYLQPIDADQMAAYEVSKAVNRAGAESPEFIQPLRPPSQPGLL